MTIEERVQKNLEQVDFDSFEGDRREAGQLLFSALTHLEQVAVEAAQKGDGIEGQYEDEVVHRDTFKAIAEKLGGLIEISEPIKNLLDFLRGLRGSMSLACLNIVCEAWLDNVFEHVSKFGVADEMFETIEAEEARHVREAKRHVFADSRTVAPIVHRLETLLADVSRDPYFIVPLLYFGGANASASLGLQACKRHRESCEHLGVDQGSYIDDMEEACRSAINVPAPVLLENLDEWEEFRLQMFDRPGEMNNQVDVKWPHPYEEFETRLIRAVSKTLVEHPELNRVISRGKMYQPPIPIIGTRRIYDASGKVGTIFVEDAHEHSVKAVDRLLKSRVISLRRQPYCSLNEVRKFHHLLPPASHSVVVTHVGVFGTYDGWAPIVPEEGPTVMIATGRVKMLPKPRKRLSFLVKWVPHVRFSVTMDHRAFNGEEIGLFCTEVERNLKEMDDGREPPKGS